jgi:hypothetical protein
MSSVTSIRITNFERTSGDVYKYYSYTVNEYITYQNHCNCRNRLAVETSKRSNTFRDHK